ncbi:UpxY family transcription antiterminator [Prevotella sp. A2931]|uniref:UpxY family transcription antiterminator n=1 Tax=Prevotella illustrans TaxID=2800387 RepID=A0ABS3M425_9BACT|nr:MULTISPECIES: UpxY family transcription antiterminator [Prevotella]MBO1362871.1 UpxY family transcription antiterminator [Prevotella illustrans]
MLFSNNEIHWFLLSPNYRRELKIKQYFESKGIACFVPMQHTYRIIAGKKRLVTVPVISNYLFVKSTYDRLKAEKQTLEQLDMPFKFRMDTMSHHQPIVISDRLMEDFITVCQNQHCKFVGYDKQADIKKGDLVEIVSGPFAGVQGYYARPFKDKCVVVLIENVAAVCTTYIPPKALRLVGKQGELV